MKQQRNTHQRQLVLDAVKSRMDHPTAEQIYVEVRASDPRVSRGTVYRNLNLLCSNGEIAHIEMPDSDRFDLRTDPHYHLLCMHCGKVMDSPYPYHAEDDISLAAETGYLIRQHHTLFEGICPACQRETAP